jgi:DNA-binding PadR family transcriptional regulator
MAQRKLSSLELALLGLIAQAPRSGYELCRIFETSPMMHYSASPGAIYPALKRLDRRGLLLGQVERSDALRPVRTYRISDTGRDAIVSWVSLPIKRDDLIWRSDELMLRFAFMGQHVDLEATSRFLTELVEVIDAYVSELEAHHRGMPEGGSPHGRLALEQGLDSYRSMAAWARRALGRLGNVAN